ncbi:asparagine synthetase B family protein [Ottowia sp. VDI28]|uniref:asparagine synthetase B family protein n=1 Tax=Ottowia sp. VDI28 TaxID=3133968 RepID=UPI003C2B448F
MDGIFGVLGHDLGEGPLSDTARVMGCVPKFTLHDPVFALAACAGGRQATGAASWATSADGQLLVAVIGAIEEAAPGRVAQVALEYYEGHGPGFVQHLHGFFAIVVWNARERRLLLCADRCTGVSGVYYHEGTDRLSFGTAAKAVVALPGVPRKIDRCALEDMLVLAHPVPPATLFAGVKQVPAGCVLEAVAGRPPRLMRYWQRKPGVVGRSGMAEVANDYMAALATAVARASASHSPPAVLLSGGVDSAAIVALLRAVGHERIVTYTLDADENDTSDRDTAARVAALYGTEHRVVPLGGASSVDALSAIVWHLEMPAPQAHPFFRLCAEVSREHDVVLGGYGNDLVWGVAWAHSQRAPQTLAGRAARYLAARRMLDRPSVARLLPGAAATDAELAVRIAGAVPNNCTDLSEDAIALDEGLFGDQRVMREIGAIATAAHGLWINSPYNAANVVAAAERVPLNARVGATLSGKLELKAFFKAVANGQRLLPLDVIYRRKQWVRSSLGAWLRGDLGARIEQLILQGPARDRALFDLAVVQQLMDAHRSGRADHGELLTMLAGVELWQRLFVDPSNLVPPDHNIAI